MPAQQQALSLGATSTKVQKTLNNVSLQ
jgi:hypothetical protein